MPTLLRMPEIAASATSAVLAGWPLAEGTSFSARDVIATVETDKAVVDVEAEADGVLLRTLATAGSDIAVGAAIAVLAAPGEVVADVDAALTELGVATARPAGAPAAMKAPSAVSPAPVSAAPAANGEPRRNGHVADSGTRQFASPLARRLASEAGLLLTDMEGTGPGGRVVRRDVEGAIASRVALEEAEVPAAAIGSGPPGPAEPVLARPVTPRTAAAEPLPTQAAPAPQPTTDTSPAWTDVPVSRVRKAIAARLTESVTTAPHFYLRGTARVDALLALRTQLNTGEGVRVTVNDLLVKAVGQAHLAVPAMNVQWTGDAVRHLHGVDVAVAVATDDGLVTPVVRGVDQRSVTSIAGITQDAAVRAKARRLQQSELEGGSITGMYGTEEFAAILNPPQAAILAVGAAVRAPVVDGDEIGIATLLKVTLSVDHRPVDGATAAQWMRAFLAILETPLRILA